MKLLAVVPTLLFAVFVLARAAPQPTELADVGAQFAALWQMTDLANKLNAANDKRDAVAHPDAIGFADAHPDGEAEPLFGLFGSAPSDIFQGAIQSILTFLFKALDRSGLLEKFVYYVLTNDNLRLALIEVLEQLLKSGVLSASDLTAAV